MTAKRKRIFIIILAIVLVVAAVVIIGGDSKAFELFAGDLFQTLTGTHSNSK